MKEVLNNLNILLSIMEGMASQRQNLGHQESLQK